MRRRHIGRDAGLSLFPFLAVLICTMGALIVVLVMTVEQARVYASSEAAQPAAQDAPHDQDQADQDQADQDNNNQAQREAAERRRQRQLEREEHLWRAEILATAREEKTAELSESRLQLSHLENHVRQLEQQWKQLQAEAERISSSDHQADQQRRQAELAQLQAEVERARAELEEARRELAERPKSYAIIPYDGPHGTRRRPIYIECTADGAVLQPEGVRLSVLDLSGPLGPGNPLDASVRAVREYWAELGLLEGAEPYPLLVVRPDGVVAYTKARAALANWDDEFGYELVGQDLELKYGPADDVLAQRVRKSIELAKQRQQLLAAAMPRAFGGSEHKTGAMIASPNGGFVPAGGGGSGPLQEELDRVMGRQTEQLTPAASGDQPGQAPPGMRHAEGAAPGGDGGAAAQGAAAGAPRSMAESRGANWALLKKTRGATAWTRPIRILCRQDRLVVLEEKGGTSPSQTVMTPGALEDQIDAFAEKVRKHIEQWGVAPAGGYWKPMLFVQVGPGGESRFQELQTLLRNSGFDVRRAR